MKKIILISPYWKEEHRWMVSSVKLAELWQRLGYKVIVACMGSATGIEEVSDTLTIHRLKDVFLPDPLNFGIALGFAGYVRRLLKKEKPDLIICNKVLFWTSFAVIPLRLTGHKVLVITDALVGMTWWPRRFIPKIIMGLGAWTVGWLVLLSAHRLVTFFPQPQKILKRLGVVEKTQVIPTGIDTSHWSQVTGHPSATLRAGGSQNEATVTYVGRLESVKGVDDFLAATASLKQNYPELNVQVVGWFKKDHPLVSQFQNEVTFTGLRDDIAEILSKTDIFVLPSYSEGLSNALMEAMASGVAPVATEVGGNRFLIENGISGFLYPPGDREALKAHIRRLIDDDAKRKAIGSAARTRIEEFFDWKIVGKKFEILFHQLMPS